MTDEPDAPLAGPVVSPRTTLSPDGLQLTVTVTQPDGTVREMSVTRSPDVGPFTDEDITKVVALATTGDRIAVGEKRSTWRLTDQVMVHVATGPPTWWLPRIEVTRRSVMVGWLRALVAVSWRERRQVPHIRTP